MQNIKEKYFRQSREAVAGAMIRKHLSTQKEKIKFSFGNKKLPKTTFIFNLPAKNTCPGKTPFCTLSCYALKAEIQYPATLPARKHNARLTRKENFSSLVIQAIAENQFFKRDNRRKIETVRIHESGDFYDQNYLEKWYFIALHFPKIIFYSYTKSFKLNFTKKPKNFILLASFDDTTTPQARKEYEKKKTYFNNTFTVIGRKEKASCIGDCTLCSICFNTVNNDITVNAH